MKKLRYNANLHGSARWAEEQEIRRMGYFEGKGVYVGGWLKEFKGLSRLLRPLQSKPDEVQLYLRHNGPEHIMVFAPTRSGKGVGLILPTLLAWEGSGIVLDIKGENWSLTAGWRKSQGHKVLRFEPSDPSGASARFNPLEEIRLDTLMAIPDVQNMAAMLVDHTGKGSGRSLVKSGLRHARRSAPALLRHGAPQPETPGHALRSLLYAG